MSISVLPTELLQLVFRTVRDDILAANEEGMSWMSLACVSRTWRDALHGDAFLWTRLAFTDATPFHVVESALERSQQVGGIDLKFVAGSSESSGCWGWLAHLSTGYPFSTYTLPEKVRFLSFRWHKGVRDTVFDGLEGLRADGVVSLVLEESEDVEDPVDDSEEVLWESSSDSGSFTSGQEMEVGLESEAGLETLGADDEDFADNEDEDADRNVDFEGDHSGVDGHWNGPESDYPSSEDGSSDVSIPDDAFGLGDDSSTYLDSDSDGGKHLSWLDDEESGEATDESGDDYDSDREDSDEDVRSDMGKMDLNASDSDEGEGDDDAVVPQIPLPQPPRIFQLPNFPSLINLATSSVLLSIPLQVKEQLTDMTLMDTSWRAEEFEKAGVVQSWMLDTLEGCVHLGRLRLYNTLAVEGHNPEQRTVALLNLKFLCVEDVLGGVQDTLRFLKASPEVPTRVDLRTLFTAEHWEPDVDGAFVGNLPINLAGPYFADTVALNLSVDDDFVLRGRTQAPELRQWGLRGIGSLASWSDNHLDRLLHHAVLDLSHPRIVAAANVTTLSIHIVPSHLTREVDWVGLVSGLPRVSKFALGGDEAVATFLGATRRLSYYWPDLTQLQFCLAMLRWDLTLNMDILCEQLWSGRGSWEPRLGVTVFLRLPGVYAPSTMGILPPDWFGRRDIYSRLEALSREHGGRVRIFGCRCKICHQPVEWVDVTYANCV
ncbi:hypothetical protein V8D89_012758 [Ganoderma adspersum]